MDNCKSIHRFASPIVLGVLLSGPTLCLADDGFIKDTTKGCSLFKPNLKAGETVVWRGACVAGNAEGYGVAQWSATDGSSVTFEGNFAKGKLEGIGKMSASGGDRYEGTYRAGKREGRGVYMTASGERYEGEYKENQRHGQGVLSSSSGARTVGEWRNGLALFANTNAAIPAAAASTPISTPLPFQSAETHATGLEAQRQAEQQQRVRAATQQIQQAAAAAQQQALQQQQPQRSEAVAQAQRSTVQHGGQTAADNGPSQRTLILWGLLSIPLLVAASVALSKWSTAISLSDRLSLWIESSREKARDRPGLFARVFLRPTLWCFKSMTTLTASIENVAVRAAVRLAAWLYLAAFALFLIYWITLFVIAVVILILGIWLFAAFFGNAGNSNLTRQTKPQSEGREEVAEYVGARGKKVYKGTNWLNEELKGRVDDEGNLYRGTNWLNEEKIGRIDGDGNIYSGTNFLNEAKVGRIDEDGTLYKGANWFTEKKTGRIDGEGTIHQGTNWLNETKKGRTGK